MSALSEFNRADTEVLTVFNMTTSETNRDHVEPLVEEVWRLGDEKEVGGDT